VVHPNGTGLAQLTSDANCDATPSWSPDGTQIVFAASPITNGKCSTKTNVYLLNAHGEQQITHGKLDGFPAFTPDGGMTWTSEDTPYDQIWTARSDGSHPQTLHVQTNHAAAASGRWQPIHPTT
jgi:Tol biopolymer transport system component